MGLESSYFMRTQKIQDLYFDVYQNEKDMRSSAQTMLLSLEKIVRSVDRYMLDEDQSQKKIFEEQQQSFLYALSLYEQLAAL